MKLFFVLLLSIQFGIAKAQGVRRQTVDKKTGQGIAFVTVKILNTPKGEIANGNGEFQIIIDSTDTVMFSCIGYHNLVMIGKEVKNIIYLEPRDNIMQPITIIENNLVGKIILGNGSANLKDILKKDHETISWGPSDNKEEFAEEIMLPDSFSMYKIKKIHIPVTKSHCLGPILLHIYLPDSASIYPGEEIFFRPIYPTAMIIEKGEIVIDLDSNHIYLSNIKSFFVSVGWPSEAAKSNCITNILMEKYTNTNTFSRTLTSNEFQWFSFGIQSDEKKESYRLSTIFSVELDELKPRLK